MAKCIQDFILKLNKIETNIKFVEDRSVAVGWVDGKTHKAKNGRRSISLAKIARILNFGTAPQFRPDGSITQRIPARPFMEVMRAEYMDYLRKVAATEIKKVANGSGTSATFFHKFGVSAKGALQRAMLQSNRYAPNAESTIRRKKSSRPLIDTGLLIQSVDYEVRKNK